MHIQNVPQNNKKINYKQVPLFTTKSLTFPLSSHPLYNIFIQLIYYIHAIIYFKRTERNYIYYKTTLLTLINPRSKPPLILPTCAVSFLKKKNSCLHNKWDIDIITARMKNLHNQTYSLATLVCVNFPLVEKHCFIEI